MRNAKGRRVAEGRSCRGSVGLVLVLFALLVACGRDPSPAGDLPAGDGGTPTPDGRAGAQRYEFSGTVLESGEHGPELCLGGVAESLPPQCRGLPVVGWDWEDVPDARSRAGTTWAEVSVQGTYDGERFTLTSPPEPPPLADGEDHDYSPACEAPEVVDPDATRASEGVSRDQIPGLVAIWVTDDVSEEWDGSYVVNVVVRPGFAADAEEAVRESWQGYLCVVERDRPLASELEEIREPLRDFLTELNGRPPWSMGANERRGAVVAHVTVVTDEMREKVDEEFGPGLVELRGRLKPVG